MAEASEFRARTWLSAGWDLPHPGTPLSSRTTPPRARFRSKSCGEEDSRAEDAAAEVLEHIDRHLGTREHLGLRTAAPELPRYLAQQAMRQFWWDTTGEEQLQTGMLKTLCLLSLTIITSSWTMVKLRGVVMPFVLAMCLMLILEPVLVLALNPFKPLTKWSSCARRLARSLDQQLEVGYNSVEESYLLRSGRACARILWKVWCVIAVAICIVIVVFVLGGCGYLLVKSFAGWSPSKYTDSPKLTRVLVRLNETGVEHELVIRGFMEGPVMSVVSLLGTVFSTFLLMSLFLAFLLLSAVGKFPYTKVFGLGYQAKRSVQRYLKLKVLTSAAVGLIIWALLVALEVELAFFFGFVTFLLNHIPYIGYTLAVLAPLPLVLLDPDKSWGDFAQCVIYPLLVHQIFISIVETRLLSITLDLHPVVVLLSLAFWTLCWGAVGAILSTPMTCMLRLALKETSHPLASSIVQLLGGNIGDPPKNKPRRSALSEIHKCDVGTSQGEADNK